MIEALAAIFTGGSSTIFSSIFGSISGLIGHWARAKEEESKRSHQIALMDMQMKMDRQESELALKEIEANLEVEKVVTEGALLKEEAVGFNPAVMKIATSNTLDDKVFIMLMDGGPVQKFFGSFLAFHMGLVDIVRGIIRPVLTAASFGIMIYLVKTYAIEDGLEEDDKMLVLSLVIDATVYVLTAAVQFWFMDRSGARDFRKKH